MSTELQILAWTVVLALLQIMVAGALRTHETGTGYNVGPRDEPGPPVGKLTGRLQRAQKNLYETLPLFAIAVVVTHLLGRENTQTAWGAGLYLGARVLYVPLYALGVPVVRTLVWLVSAVGLLLVLQPSLLPV